jgi:hypothetical protein
MLSYLQQMELCRIKRKHDMCIYYLNINFYDMKNLPATIGLIAILTLFVFFKGNPDHAAQAAPVTSNSMEMFQQDTFPPKPMDTTMKHHKKDKKKKDSTWKQRRDTL